MNFFLSPEAFFFSKKKTPAIAAKEKAFHFLKTRTEWVFRWVKDERVRVRFSDQPSTIAKKEFISDRMPEF